MEEPEGLVPFFDSCTAKVCGRLEWMSIELRKNRALEKAERAQALSQRFEGVCDRLESLTRSLGKDVPSGLDADLRARMSTVEQAVDDMTGDGTVFTDDQDRRLSEGMDALEAVVAAGERLQGRPVSGGAQARADGFGGDPP